MYNYSFILGNALFILFYFIYFCNKPIRQQFPKKKEKNRKKNTENFPFEFPFFKRVDFFCTGK